MALNIVDIHGEIEGDYDIITTLPRNATNGDVIKALFPETKSRLDERTGIMLVKWEDGTTKCYKADWWNTPYKENKDGSNNN